MEMTTTVFIKAALFSCNNDKKKYANKIGCLLKESACCLGSQVIHQQKTKCLTLPICWAMMKSHEKVESLDIQTNRPSSKT